MKYILLIYSEETKEPKPGTAEFGEMMQGYMALHELVRKHNVHVAGEPLEDISTATTVAVRDGESVITDGPFAETKEQLGGYYLLECKDLDQAIEWAQKAYTDYEIKEAIRYIKILKRRKENNRLLASQN